eukprot:gb/GECG01006013.1/.p1 GENE.gb/GECG01006013.1/~~gb/GECG01006013.1/.p1  ORF type:complete len:700 (+),score=89.69 gb/GECG01006013.1/:1-2100(+)
MGGNHSKEVPDASHTTRRSNTKRGGRKHAVAAAESAPKSPAASSLADLIEQDTSRMYIHLDPDSIIRYVSAASERFLGYSSEDMVGHRNSSFIHENDRETVENKFLEAKRAPHTAISVKFRRKHNNGMHTRVEFYGHWICKHDEPIGITGWEQDAERGKNEQEELVEEASTTKDQTAAENSKIMTFALHELRNAIHALDASATYIEELTGETMDDEVKESVNDMMFAAKNTNVLVGDILSLIGLREGTVITNAEDFPIRSYIKDLTASMQTLSSVPVVPVVTEEVPVVVCADWDSIAQILKNGLMNAIKYCGQNTEPIYVRVSKEETHLTFEVRDKGTSLGDVSQEKLMKALTQGIPLRGARAQRTSLFLPIADNVVRKLMFGKVGIDSHEGVTKFWFTAKYSPTSDSKKSMMAVREEKEWSLVAQVLPGSSERPEPISTKQSSSVATPTDKFLQTITPEGSASPTSTPKRSREKKVIGVEGDGKSLNLHVLLVDDQKVVRRQAASFLDQLGCTYKLLDDGDQVTDALAQTYRPFDAIILDILMHRSDGAEVCQKLRESKGVQGPIIAMTSQTESRDVQRYYSMGFDVVLSKPFTRDSLGKSLLEGQQRRGHFTKFSRMSARLEEEEESTKTNEKSAAASNNTYGGSQMGSDFASPLQVSASSNDQDSSRPPAHASHIPGSTDEAIMPLGLPPRRQHFR